MIDLLSSWRFTLRSLAHNRTYSLIALLTLVLGIGSSTAVFSIVNGVLFEPLAFPDSGRLVRLSEVNAHGHEMRASWRGFVDWRREATRFESLAAYGGSEETTVLGTSEPLRVKVVAVSDGFLRTLRVAPILGRPFTSSDHRLGAEPTIMVSEGFWRSSLGADPNLASHPLTIDGNRARIVGVMPRGFEYPGGTEIWYPAELFPQSQSRTAHNDYVVGRLKAGVTASGAKAELDTITRRFASDSPEATGPGADDYFPRSVAVVPLLDEIVGGVQRPLWILLGAALLVLLVACVDVASATFARGTNREHELAVRHALGAGRAKLLGTAVAEVVTLSALGALAGIGAAWATLRVLPRFAPPGLPRVHELHLDARVVIFALALSAFAALVGGVLPALRVSARAVASLRSVRSSGNSHENRIWKGLVACEIAFSLVLLVGAGLLLRSFRTILEVDPGYRTSGLLTATVDPPSSKYGSDVAKRMYFDALLQRLRAMPGVQSVGLISAVPPAGSPSNGQVKLRGSSRPTASGDYQIADAGAFRALGIPLLHGRLFDERDQPDGQHVVVVNHAFAEIAWPGEDPIGKEMDGGGMDDFWNKDKWATVIGEVGDVRQDGLALPASPAFYFFDRQRPFRASSMTAVLRPAQGRPDALAPGVREIVRDLDSSVPVEIETMRDRMAGALAARRFILVVVLGFAVVALLLAAVGVYGVVAYAVERRQREIGVRLALGASPHAVRRLMQREYMLAAGIGGVAGILVALGLTRLMSSLLFEVRPTDPATFATVVAMLGATVWIASFVSSLRGTRVDPTEAFRAE